MFDLLVSGAGWYVIEASDMPGFTSASLFAGDGSTDLREEGYYPGGGFRPSGCKPLDQAASGLEGADKKVD